MKIQPTTFLFRKRVLLLIAVSLLLLIYFLGQEITVSEPLNRRPEVGTRGLGLSGAFIIGTDDATSPLWNPAGLATLRHGNFGYDLSQGAVSLAYPVKPFGTFALNFLDFNRDDRFLIDHTANPIGSFELGNNQVLLSYGRQLGALQLGASAGYSRAPYHDSLWAPNYDIGVLAQLNAYLTLGLRFRDIAGVTVLHSDGTVLQTFDQQVALGAVLTPHPLIRWHNRFDLNDPGFGTSVEMGNRTFVARVGSLFPFGTDARPQSWSVGFSVNYFGKHFHYAYLNHDDFQHKHLAAIGMSFGGGRPSTEGLGTARTTESLRNISAYKAAQIAQEYGIDVELALAIMHTESRFDPLAVSPTGAAGLMQMMPATARELGLQVPTYKNKRNPTRDPKVDDRFDPHKNLHAGLAYFKGLFEKYQHDLTLALGAYNVGPGKVRIRGPLISRGKRYANKVIARYRGYQKDAALLEADLQRLERILNNSPDT